MLTTIDLSATTSVVSTAVLGGVIWLCNKGRKAYNFLVAHKEEEKLIWNEIRDHIKRNPAAVLAVTEAEQAATVPSDADPAIQQMLIKDALRDGLQALRVEATNVDTTNRLALIKYAQDRVPDAVKPLVAPALDGILQAIKNGEASAAQHKAIQAALELAPDAPITQTAQTTTVAATTEQNQQ